MPTRATIKPEAPPRTKGCAFASDAGQYVVAGQRSQAQLRMKASASRDDVAPSTRRTFKSSLGGRVVTTAPAARPGEPRNAKAMQAFALAQAEELPALVLAPGGDEREQLLLRAVDDEEQPATLLSFLNLFQPLQRVRAAFCGSSLSKDALQGCFWLCQLDLHAEQLLLRVAAVDSTTRAFKDP